MTLDEIRKLIEAATPGPWKLTSAPDWEQAADECDPMYTIDAEALSPAKTNGWTGPTLMEWKHYYPVVPKRIEDARFIAAARTLLPALLEVATAALACEGDWQDGYHSRPLHDALEALQAIPAPQP